MEGGIVQELWDYMERLAASHTWWQAAFGLYKKGWAL